MHASGQVVQIAVDLYQVYNGACQVVVVGFDCCKGEDKYILASLPDVGAATLERR